MLGKKDDNALLCLDIGAASIKACVFYETEDELEFRGHSLVQQQHGNIQRGQIVHLAQTISKVQEAVRKAENMAKKSPEDLVIGLSGELVKGMTVSLSYERNDPKKLVDAQELKTIIYELQWQAFDSIRKHISDEMSIPEMDLKLVNASIVSIFVDGEAVQDPRGQKGKVIEMDIFNCFAPIQHFGQIQSIAVELPYHQLKGVFIQSFAVCHALALQNALESAVVIDIGASTTDVCAMVDGKIVGNRSYSMGGDSLTKRLSFELSTSFPEAEHIKMGYCQDSLERKSAAVIAEALESDIEVWITSLDLCLKELTMKKLPGKILLCGKASLMPEFKQALEKHDWAKNFPTDGEIEVRALDYRDILSGDYESDDVEREYLPLIAVASTAHDLLYNNESVEGILNAIIADRGV